MKIARAMKKLALLKGDIGELEARISSNISTIDGNEFEENFSELFEKLNAKINKLVEMKTKIMKANVENGVYEKILRIGEYKGLIDFLKNLEIKRGRKTVGYSEKDIVEFISQISVSERNKMVDEIKDNIIQATDDLDEFNSSTDI